MCRRVSLTLVLSAWFACVAMAQSSSLSARIRAGDVGAMEVAAASGDRVWIADIRGFLTGHDAKNNQEAVQSAHEALALLGDVSELQSRWCRAVSVSPAESTQRIDDLNMGGWFAIYSISRFLLPEFRDRFLDARSSYVSTHPRDDVLWMPVEVFAVRLLESFVPNPPVHSPSVYMDSLDKARRRAPMWLKWIDETRWRLMTLRPTGEGVVFTLDACRDK